MKNRQNIDKAIKLFNEAKYEASKKLAQRTLKYEKNSVELLSLLVMVCTKLNDLISKKHYLLKLVKLVQDPNVYQTLALLYQEENNTQKAKQFYEKALEINPNYAKCYLYLGLIYMSEYEFAKSQELILKAIELTEGTQDIYESYHFLAMLYEEMQEYDKALEIYIQLLRLNYTDAQMMSNLSLLCLKMHRYLDGFNFYRYRYHPDKKGSQKVVKDVEILNKGVDIDGKNILIIGEQGVGDVIQFARYLPLFQEKNAKISMSVSDLVLDLLKNSYPDIEFSNKIEHTNYDYSLLIGDAPYIFSTEYNNIPFSDKYLKVNKQESLLIKEKYFKNKSKKKIGIVWRSNTSDSVNETLMLAKKRIIHNMELKDYIKYFKQEGIQLYSLQVKTTEAERKLLQENNIPSLGDNFVSFYDNALVIDNLDVLIAINTASALLSGAMGKKTIIFLLDSSDWRWGIEDSTSNWYKSVTLVRQKDREGWESLIKRTLIFNDLTKL